MNSFEFQVSSALGHGADFNRLLNEPKQQSPRGLKPARDDENKDLIGTTKVVP